MKNKIKTTESLTAKLRIFTTCLLAFAFLFSCGPSREEKAKLDKLNEVKKSVTAELEKVNKDLTERIAYLENEIAQATGELKQNLEQARNVLIDQQTIIVNEIRKVKDCGIDAWSENVKKTSETLKEIRAKSNETSKKVRELLDSQGLAK